MRFCSPSSPLPIVEIYRPHHHHEEGVAVEEEGVGSLTVPPNALAGTQLADLPNEGHVRAVMQQYVNRPFLYNRHKFHLRPC